MAFTYKRNVLCLVGTLQIKKQCAAYLLLDITILNFVPTYTIPDILRRRSQQKFNTFTSTLLTMKISRRFHKTFLSQCQCDSLLAQMRPRAAIMLPNIFLNRTLLPFASPTQSLANCVGIFLLQDQITSCTHDTILFSLHYLASFRKNVVLPT